MQARHIRENIRKSSVMNIYQFDPQVYPRRLWVSVEATTEELQQKFRKDDIKDMDDSYYAQTICVQQKEPLLGGVLVRFQDLKAMSLGNIAHEATHAALEIFDYCDCRIDVANQEPFAYLVGWIVRCIDEVRNAKSV